MLFEENAPVKAINPIFGQKIVDKDDLFPKGYKDGGTLAYNAVIGSIHDYDMCMESATFDEIDKYYNPGIEEVDASFILESIVIQKFSRTEHRMNAVVRTLNKHLGDSEIKALPAIVGKPKKTGGFAYVTVQLPFSDGQTVSVIFHAPEGDQKKIAPNDTIVAFRWLLNKRDITHVVSPEEGEEVSLESIGVRVTQLVKKNSARFEATQKQAVEEKKELEEATQAVKDAKEKEQELMDAVAEIKQKEITNDAELSNTLTLLEKQKAINAELQAKLDGLRKSVEQHRRGDGGGNKGVSSNEQENKSNLPRNIDLNVEKWSFVIENADLHRKIKEANFKNACKKSSEYINNNPDIKNEFNKKNLGSNIRKIDKKLFTYPVSDEEWENLQICLSIFLGNPPYIDYRKLSIKLMNGFFDELVSKIDQAIAKEKEQTNTTNTGTKINTNLVTDEFVRQAGNWYSAIYNNEQNFKDFGVDELYSNIVKEADKYLSDPANSDFIQAYNSKTNDFISSDRQLAAFYLAVKNITIPKDGDVEGFKDAFRQALGIAPSNTDNNTGSNTGTGTGTGIPGLGWDDILGEDNENNEEVAKARKTINTLQKKYKCFSETNWQYQVMKSDDWLNENSRLVGEIENMIKSMPKIYSQDGKGDNAIVGMHYYTPNSDYYIMELDHSTGEIFGFSILHGDTQNAELGYSSLEELAVNGYEMDFYWDKKTLGQIKKKKGIKTDEEEAEEQAENNNGGNMPEQTENTAGNNEDAEIQGYIQELEDIKSGKYDAEGSKAVEGRIDAIADKLDQLGKSDEFEKKLIEAADRLTMLQRKRSA